MPAHLRRQNRAPAHSVGRTRVRHWTTEPASSSPCHLPTSHQPCNSGERRPVQDWVRSSQILEAASGSEPFQPAPPRSWPLSSSRPSTETGRMTALPAAPAVQPTRPRRQRPLLTGPRAATPHSPSRAQHRSPRPSRRGGPRDRAEGRTSSGPQLPRMHRARRAVPGLSEARRSGPSVSGERPAPLAARDVRAAGSFGCVAERAVSQQGAPRPAPPSFPP